MWRCEGQRVIGLISPVSVTTGETIWLHQPVWSSAAAPNGASAYITYLDLQKGAVFWL